MNNDNDTSDTPGHEDALINGLSVSARLRQIEHGLYNKLEACKLLGVNGSTFGSLTRRGRLPLPTRKLDGYSTRFYSLADIRSLRRLLGA